MQDKATEMVRFFKYVRKLGFLKKTGFFVRKPYFLENDKNDKFAL